MLISCHGKTRQTIIQLFLFFIRLRQISCLNHANRLQQSVSEGKKSLPEKLFTREGHFFFFPLAGFFISPCT